MVVAVGIVEAQYAPIVTLVDRVVDVGQVVPGHYRSPFLDIAPNLIAQEPAARLWLELETVLLK